MIRKTFFSRIIFGLIILSVPAYAQNIARTTVIPKPNRIELKSGEFSLSKNTRIILQDGSQELRLIGEQLAARLRIVTGYPFEIVTSKKKADDAIILMTDEGEDELGNEGYQLRVTKSSVTIKGRRPAGVFYGVQTLYQLLPPEVERNELVPGKDWRMPCVRVEDSPRFPWRGMHLDVGRHFFPKEFVKKYIDILASHKMNTFHWHLTEDQGWRIEIKKYPRLTKVGAWRRETMEDNTPHGGFYTQDDIREVVEYAKLRFITIVPEIEMPGHSLAALTSYPELSCSGGPFKVGTEWGIFNDV